MNGGHVDELVDLEAIGALTPAESARVHAHVAACAACRAELSAAQDTAARLALAVPLHPAPAALRARVLREVDRLAPLIPVPLPVRRPSAWRRVTSRWGALAAALIVIPVLGLLTWAVVLQTQVNELKQESRQIREAQADVVLMAMPGLIRARLDPTESGGTARGWVMWDPDEGRCTVRVKGLAKPEPGVSYRVYTQGVREPVDVGELKPNDEGTADLEFDVPRGTGTEYHVWVAAVKPHGELSTPLLRATLRRE